MVPNRDQVLTHLRAHRSDLLAMGVHALYLFGSVARGEAHEGSDVDLLVEFEGRFSYFDLCRVELQLTEWLGFPVDLVPRLLVRPELKGQIEQEAVLAA